MSALSTQSTTPATVPSGTAIAADQVGTANAPATGDRIQYVKLDVGAAGASSPITSANPLPVVDAENDVARSTRLKPADTLAGVTTVGAVTAITNPLPAGTNVLGQVWVPPATLVVTAVSSANTAVTATLPAVASQFHYISRIVIERVATAAVTGSAVLTYTSTNLPGSWARTTGNAAALGVLNKDVDEILSTELKSVTVNANTTIVAPAGGATVIIRITVYYRTAA